MLSSPSVDQVRPVDPTTATRDTLLRSQTSWSAILPKLAAGGTSCVIVSAIFNPMDVVKVRLQLQDQLMAFNGHSSSPYRGFFHGLVKIARDEGFFGGLMKGITPSTIREATYSSLRLGLYDMFKSIYAFKAKDKDEITLLQKMLAGASSGAVGNAIANPTDLIKIRFQAVLPNTPRPYRNTFHAFQAIYAAEGLRGLYKGVGPTTTRAAIVTAAQLASYDHSKRYLLRHGYQDNIHTHLFCSILAGLITATVTNPVDLVKTRIMADKAAYKGAMDCFIKIVQHEGFRGLFRGWVPNYLRFGPHFIISIPLLEQLRKWFGVDTL